MDISWLIAERRSTRVEFDPVKTISKDNMEKIIESARWAPTPHNMQNFEILIVDDKKRLSEISEIKRPISEEFVRENYELLSFSEDELAEKKVGLLGNSFPDDWKDQSKWDELFSRKDAFPLGDTIKNASALFIALYDPKKRAPASKGDFLGILGLGCVMENMWLVSNALGISVQIISALSDESVEKDVKNLLGIPENLKIAFSMRLGYPKKEQKSQRVRRNTETFTHHNHF